MTSALVDLSGLIDPGWQPVGAVGYYVHRGHVYLAGVLATLRGPVGGITDTSAPPAGRTLIATLPEAIRPTVPVHASLPVDPENTTDAGTPVLNLPTTPYAVTVDPSGTISLDADPPDQVNTTPDPSVYLAYAPGVTGSSRPQWTSPLALALGLASLSWRVALVGDTFTPEPLGPFLHAAHFADIDSGYFTHGERVHLTGSVRAVVDGAQILLDSLPPGTDAGLPAGGAVVGITDGPGENVMYVQGGGDLEVSLDEIVPLKPTGQSPPLSGSSPPHTVPVPFPDSTTTFGNFIVQDVSGLDTGAETEVGIIHGHYEDFDFGYHACRLGPPFGDTTKNCPNSSPPPPFSFDIHDLLAQVLPAPAWFYLTLWVGVRTATDHDGFALWGTEACKLYVSPTDIGDCGPLLLGQLVDENGTYDLVGCPGLASGDGSLVSPGNHLSGGPIEWSTAVTGDEFMIPPASLYTGSLELLGASPGSFPVESLLWRADQARVITVSFNQAACGGSIPNGDHFGDGSGPPNPLAAPPVVNWYAQIRPMYERRQMGLHAGDVLTLEGSGWPGVLPGPGRIPSSIAATHAATGVVRRD